MKRREDVVYYWHDHICEAIPRYSLTENTGALGELVLEWRKKKESYKIEYWGADGKRGWPAKLTKIDFIYQGRYYEMNMEDIGIEYETVWDEGFFEFLEQYIAEDLKKIGATEVRTWGMLD